jgi:hypothetical protein
VYCLWTGPDAWKSTLQLWCLMETKKTDRGVLQTEYMPVLLSRNPSSETSFLLWRNSKNRQILLFLSW